MGLDAYMLGPYTVLKPRDYPNQSMDLGGLVEISSFLRDSTVSNDWSVVFDLENVIHAPSSFMGLITNIYLRRQKPKQVKLKVINLCDNMRGVFDTLNITGGKGFVNCYDSKEDILKVWTDDVPYKRKPRRAPLFFGEGLELRNPLVVDKKSVVPKRKRLTFDYLIYLKKNYFNDFFTNDKFLYVGFVPSCRDFDKFLAARMDGVPFNHKTNSKPFLSR